MSIDLTGPHGNAYHLLSAAKTYSYQLGLDHQLIQDEMKAGDYENLVNVFEKHFGAYITLYR